LWSGTCQNFDLTLLARSRDAVDGKIWERIEDLDKTLGMKLAQRYIKAEGEKQSVDQLLSTFSGACCSEIRDKVFGILSLVPECCQKAISVDYTAQLLDICQGVLTHRIFVHEHKTFDTTTAILEGMRIGQFHGNMEERTIRSFES
jgi:hypothetical protein